MVERVHRSSRGERSRGALPRARQRWRQRLSARPCPPPPRGARRCSRGRRARVAVAAAATRVARLAHPARITRRAHAHAVAAHNVQPERLLLHARAAKDALVRVLEHEVAQRVRAAQQPHESSPVERHAQHDAPDEGEDVVQLGVAQAGRRGPASAGSSSASSSVKNTTASPVLSRYRTA